jgi:hypothetical protein
VDIYVFKKKLRTMVIYNNRVFDFLITMIIYQNQVFDSLIIMVITFDTRRGLGAISNSCPLWKSPYLRTSPG